jgi:hypothetical protein
VPGNPFYRTARQRTAPSQIFFLYLVLLRWDLRCHEQRRAVRYRGLALAEEDKAKADLLLKLADECDGHSLHRRMAFGRAIP